jgi:hypothetical protein
MRSHERSIDDGVVLEADVEKIFVPPVELASKHDWANLVVAMAKLEYSAGQFLSVVRSLPAAQHVKTVEDLQRLIGRAGDISSVADMEKLFKLS